MESLYLLIPVALIFVAIAVKIFFWAVKSGQYDDLETEAHRILFDEETPAPDSNAKDDTEVPPSEPSSSLSSSGPSGSAATNKDNQ